VRVIDLMMVALHHALACEMLLWTVSIVLWHVFVHSVVACMQDGVVHCVLMCVHDASMHCCVVMCMHDSEITINAWNMCKGCALTCMTLLNIVLQCHARCCCAQRCMAGMQNAAMHAPLCSDMHAAAMHCALTYMHGVVVLGRALVCKMLKSWLT
jgi:hypothetical protein